MEVKKNVVKGCVLSVWQQAHVSAVVKEDSHCVIRQLVAEAVLVGVVHPFSHPLKVASVGALRHVVGCGTKRTSTVQLQLNKPVFAESNYCQTGLVTSNINIKTHLLACSRDILLKHWPQSLLHSLLCCLPSLWEQTQVNLIELFTNHLLKPFSCNI